MAKRATKKTEEAVVEEKSTKKKTVSKEKKKLMESEFTIADMVKWTDEECKTKEKEYNFEITDLRDALRAFINTHEELINTRDKLNTLKLALGKGLMTGYIVVCPHCKREYVVNSMELNRDSNVVCKVCGTEYKENENIEGIAMVADEAVSNVVKDNETVVI